MGKIENRVGGNYGERDGEMLIAQWQACIDFDIVDRLPHCEVPIHAIGFEQDLQTPPPLVKRMASLAGNGHFHLLPGLGHVSCEVHKPDVVNARSRDHLARDLCSHLTAVPARTGLGPPVTGFPESFDPGKGFIGPRVYSPGMKSPAQVGHRRGHRRLQRALSSDQAGWKDVVLCERKELTAGSSWHAAGGFHALDGDPNVSRLQAYTVQLYREIEALSGQDVGLHFTGGLNVAATAARWDFLRADAARHRVLGLNSRLVSPKEIRELCPLMDVSEVLGGIYDPMEGHLDPYGATHAFAKAARLNGAEIYRHAMVSELHARADGTWTVVTEKGSIVAEHVVNAGGLWAREVGRMAGVELPVVPMEHHYLLTDELPEIKNARSELPLVLDLDGEIYLRQEQNGVLLGVYEQEATPTGPWRVLPGITAIPNCCRPHSNG